MESQNNQREIENKKINEMKERIQKYKNELRKNTEIDDLIMNSARRERLSYHVKHKDIIERKLRDLAMEKLSPNEESELLKNLNNNKLDKILEEKNNKNDNNTNNINNINNNNIRKKEDKILKDQYNTINNEKDIKKEKEKKEEKEKEKERDKSYSRAMERFRKKYKNDNSMEIKSKKSEKINEIAKRLEKVIGNQNPNVSAEIKNENNISNDIVHETEKIGENIFEILLESKPVVTKKPKKKQKFQF